MNLSQTRAAMFSNIKDIFSINSNALDSYAHADRWKFIDFIVKANSEKLQSNEISFLSAFSMKVFGKSPEEVLTIIRKHSLCTDQLEKLLQTSHPQCIKWF